MATSDVPPNQTVYVANLNESVNKEELRRSVYSLFSQHGRIMDVVALKTRKMRGQAFVVFSTIASASAAMHAQNGAKIYGRPMRVGYAKSKSHAVMKEEGTFGRPEKKQKKTQAKAPPKAAVAVAIEGGAAAGTGATTGDDGPAPMDDEDDDDSAPNNKLFVSNLPSHLEESASQQMVEALFGSYQGFKEVRLARSKRGDADSGCDIAFVEYESVEGATEARKTLQNFKVTPTHLLKIKFAK